MRWPKMTTRRWMFAVALAAIATSGAISIAGARESARREKCASNLKQIGMALHDYHSGWGSFPPGTVGDRTLPPDRRLGWPVLLFQFFTQGLQLIEDIKDGTSTTMLLAETVSIRGPWTAGGPGTVRGLDPSQQPYIGAKRQFGGAHRGGAMVAFADGSVRFLSGSIDSKVFEALSTIAGGERVPSF